MIRIIWVLKILLKHSIITHSHTTSYTHSSIIHTLIHLHKKEKDEGDNERKKVKYGKEIGSLRRKEMILKNTVIRSTEDLL